MKRCLSPFLFQAAKAAQRQAENKQKLADERAKSGEQKPEQNPQPPEKPAKPNTDKPDPKKLTDEDIARIREAKAREQAEAEAASLQKIADQRSKQGPLPKPDPIKQGEPLVQDPNAIKTKKGFKLDFGGPMPPDPLGSTPTGK